MTKNIRLKLQLTSNDIGKCLQARIIVVQLYYYYTILKYEHSLAKKIVPHAATSSFSYEMNLIKVT